MSTKKDDTQLFSLPMKRGMSMMIDADRCMRMFSETLKTLIDKEDTVDNWPSTAIPDYMDAYLNAKVVKDYIEKRLMNPDDNVKEFLKVNKVEGILFTRAELGMLHTLVTNLDEVKEYLKQTYGFSTLLN